MLQITHSVFLTRFSRIMAAIIMLLTVPFATYAGGSDGGKFDPGKSIMDHIGDSHEWHLFGDVSVPLPVIVKGMNGFTLFSSSNFHHDNKGIEVVEKGADRFVRHNNTIYFASAIQNEEGAWIEKNETGEVMNDTPLDLSITKNVASLFFSLIFMLWLFFSVAKAYARRKGEAPKGVQSFMEPLILFVRDEIAKPSIGEKKYMKFMPFLLTVFFFIWINNLLGLVPIIPGGANLTGNIAVTLTLSVFTFLITTVVANKNYWHHVFAMPGVPVWVLFLLTPIEILGIFLRPFVLMIRLFANITAGHIIVLSFFSLIFIFGEMNPGLGFGVSILSVGFVVFMTMLELLVAFLQAYVFTLLSAIYFGAAVEEHHHDHDGVDAKVEEAAII
ncbi:MAG: ATP synthase F0 subunit A [Bacteroidetes bacterium]|nr:MAG: ATP synthase F0 subunit A [Bacteroidota bacterium]REK35185.1 MAG: ATP synthase F0 subunit A [Bacteroidota bacterium]REK48262.1 MAG: ATP synthase F0 subunit A [Bacteroidota bacterium]